MYTFEIVDMNDVDIGEYYGFERKSPFTTIPWLKYLMEDNAGEPLILRISKGENLIGYFTGVKIKRFGINILGSPFKGWATGFMGYDLYDYDLVKELLTPTIDFIFKNSSCKHIEIMDRHLFPDDIEGLKYDTEIFTTVEIPIYKTDEEFFENIMGKCRQLIRQFERRGAMIEKTEPNDELAREIHDQLCEVFAKQNLVPTFSLEKINNLFNNLKDTGMLHCYVVKEPGGTIISSIVFVGMGKKMFCWCTESRREHLNYRPNEYMIWHCLREFRDMGYEMFDYAGAAEYKYKWNPIEVSYVRVMASKHPVLLAGRNMAQAAYWKLLKLRGVMRRC